MRGSHVEARQSIVSQIGTAGVREIPFASEKTKNVIFLLVAVVSMIVPLTVASPASAQQPAAQATGAVDSNGFPLKAPPGWNQKNWDKTLRFCRDIVKKARAHQELDMGEISGSGTCTSLSVEFLNPQKGPLPGSYISPDPSGQEPAAQATGASRPDGFPVKAPAGWSQKQWDETLRFCDHIAEKARAHKELEEGEIAQAGVCKSLSVDFLNPQGPVPGAYISPDRSRPAPSVESPGSPQSKNPGCIAASSPP
jgi:hypothetical protein